MHQQAKKETAKQVYEAHLRDARAQAITDDSIYNTSFADMVRDWDCYPSTRDVTSDYVIFSNCNCGTYEY